MKYIISFTFCLMQLKKVPFSCNITQYSVAGKFTGNCDKSYKGKS